MQKSIRSYASQGVGFGTSGVRATVEALTDEVCFAYAAAFLGVLARRGGGGPVPEVAIGHDLRPSSPRITAACLAACAAAGTRAVYCGALPTPALANFALRRGVPAIVVTGSHIPFDRNGIKFYTSEGEILKDDETAIADATVDLPADAFDARGMLRAPAPLPPADPAAMALYRERYVRLFPPGLLRGRRVGVYEHSSVARDVLSDVLRQLGADVVSLGRTDTFVPVDTEAVGEADQRQGRAWAAEHRLDAIVSTDGDADRPLLADETGTWLRGDLVGMLCARYVGAHVVVTPVSSNTAVERWGVFPRVVRTRIGSPYVIAAMVEAARQGDGPVAGYEANGGFLLGSDVTRASGPLASLPTRDALLPILSLLALAAEKGAPLSSLSQGLPARFTASDRLQNFATERSRQLLAELASGPEALAAFFAELGAVKDVNLVDGLRVTLASGDVVHLRPSGNAPELRCYGEADTPERAAQLSRWGLARAAERARG